MAYVWEHIMVTSWSGKLPERTVGVISRELGDEFVVIHPATQTAHSLSDLPAIVWRATDGGPRPQAPKEEIDAAVDHLIDLDLLVAPPGMTRRRVLQHGGVMIAAAGIMSIALPEAVAAASTVMSFTFNNINPGTGTFTIPKNARNATVTLAGASGGGSGGTVGVGGTVIWTISGNTSQDIIFGYTLGTAGTGPTPGTGWDAGGAGATVNGTGSKAGGGGGGSTGLSITSGGTGTLIAGGGGGSGGKQTGNTAGGSGGGGGTQTGGLGANGAAGSGGPSGSAGGIGGGEPGNASGEVPGAGGTTGGAGATNGGGGGGGSISGTGGSGTPLSTTVTGGGGGGGKSYISVSPGSASIGPAASAAAGSIVVTYLA